MRFGCLLVAYLELTCARVVLNIRHPFSNALAPPLPLPSPYPPFLTPPHCPSRRFPPAPPYPRFARQGYRMYIRDGFRYVRSVVCELLAHSHGSRRAVSGLVLGI